VWKSFRLGFGVEIVNLYTYDTSGRLIKTRRQPLRDYVP
jgi:hypothetical protein